jgi:hypothetical protein
MYENPFTPKTAGGMERKKEGAERSAPQTVKKANQSLF